MARAVNHRLSSEHLEERALPSDVGCAAAPIEGAVAETEGIATGDTFAAEIPDSTSGVLAGHRVQMDEDGTVVAVMRPESPSPAEPVQVDAENVPLTAAASEFNFADELVHDLRFDLTAKVVAPPKLVHEEMHPTGRRITEGTLTWGVDALLTVDPVDVVKLILGSMGEAQAA